jgi:hypothetical protein
MLVTDLRWRTDCFTPGRTHLTDAPLGPSIYACVEPGKASGFNWWTFTHGGNAPSREAAQELAELRVKGQPKPQALNRRTGE